MTATAHHAKCLDYAAELAEQNGAEGGEQAAEWGAQYLADGMVDCQCDYFRAADEARTAEAPAAEVEAAEVTPEMIRIMRSASPLNGIITVYVEYAEEDEMVRRELLWTTGDGDVFLDHAGYEWLRTNPEAPAEVEAPAVVKIDGAGSGACATCGGKLDYSWRVTFSDGTTETRCSECLPTAPAEAVRNA